jgi:O-antigen/teichoic acid export membrane protein
MLDNNTSVPPHSLKYRVLSAGFWSIAGQAITYVLRLGGNLIMTRILVPEAFGLMAVTIIVMGAMTMFSDFGIKQSIVQSKRGSDPVFLNTAWVMQIFRGFGLFSITLGASLLFVLLQRLEVVPRNSIYADPILPAVLAVMSINFVIGAFQSTKIFEANRTLALGRLAIMEAATQSIALLCMLAWASIDRSVWALVAGSIGSAVATVLLAHLSLPGVDNRWMWDRSAFREIFHFGKWIFLSSVLGFLAAHGDRLLLGGLMSSTSFGVYVIAFLIFGTVQQALTSIINAVVFPALSEVNRERPDNLKSTYYRFHLIIGSFAYFCSGALMISGHTLIGVLYDHRYDQAGWMLEILAVALLATPFQVAGVSFLALGLPKLLSQILVLRVVCLFVLLPAGLHFFGVPGALWGLVLSYLSIVPSIVFYKHKFKLLDFRIEILMLAAIGLGMSAGKIFNVALEYLFN